MFCVLPCKEKDARGVAGAPGNARRNRNRKKKIEFGGHRPISSTSTKTHLPFPSLPQPNHQEPIITWSFIIGGIGLAIPLVVPPLRDAVTPASRKQPPSVAQLLGREGAAGGGVAATAAAAQK